MSKSLKRVIGVVAAIAIPFAAPAIAASLGVSAAIGTAMGVGASTAATVGSALTGAALSAGSAALTGGDVGKAALFGGIGGGFAGYASPAAQTYRAAQATQAAGSAGTGSAGLAGAGLEGVAATAPAGLSTAAAPAAGTAAAAGTTAGAPMTFTQALKNVPSQIAATFSDPGKLADLTLRAGGQLAGSALSDSGLSPEEKGLLNAQTEELRNLQQTNRAAFDARMQQAMSLIGESRYFDPEYFGLQRARREQVAVGRQRQAGLRGLSGGRRQAEGRRYDIESGRRTGTAYDVGYGQGIAGRLQTRQAGIAAMPTEFSPQAFGGYESLLSSYGVGANRQRQQQEDIGNLFGSFTGGYGAKKTGDEKEEEKA